ncbi:MAG: LamG domain-containing protein [Verrucomicrobia bacterium]|nr:LamG domain-containing protein [Verrucomicrobiota bacterium]
MALAGTVWAGQDRTERQIRLELDLADGSHVVGTPEIESLPVQTSYAKMDIPLHQILAIKMGEDHETATFDLRNGDKLKGVLTLAPVKLETVFGKVAIGVEHIRTFRVVLSLGALPDSLKHGLVLHYSFDRDEKGKVTDESGKGNAGEVKGAKWTAEGRIGGACSFDGRSDYLSCPNAALKSLQNHSVCFWVCRTGNGSNWPRFFMNGVVNTSITITQAGSDREIVYRFSANGINDDLATDTLPLVDNEWVHIACTYDGSARKIYRNGVKIAGKAGAVMIAHGEGNLAYVGGSEHIQASSFAGKLDEVMIFNRALSEPEVKQIYDAQK